MDGERCGCHLLVGEPTGLCWTWESGVGTYLCAQAGVTTPHVGSPWLGSLFSGLLVSSGSSLALELLSIATEWFLEHYLQMHSKNDLKTSGLLSYLLGPQ